MSGIAVQDSTRVGLGRKFAQVSRWIAQHPRYATCQGINRNISMRIRHMETSALLDPKLELRWLLEKVPPSEYMNRCIDFQ